MMQCWITLIYERFRKLRTTQIDLFFNKIYDRMESFNLVSPESKQMIQEVGNIL